MNKRRLLAVFIAFVLTIAATAMWSASTDEREGDADAIVLEDSGSEAGESHQPRKKGGNKVVKVLAAPFKAFGKLFGRGGDDKNKIYRMTEKDAERFETPTGALDRHDPFGDARVPPVDDQTEHRAEMGADDVARPDDLDGASDSIPVLEGNDVHAIIPPRDIAGTPRPEWKSAIAVALVNPSRCRHSPARAPRRPGRRRPRGPAARCGRRGRCRSS